MQIFGRDYAAVLLGLKFADDIHYKFRVAKLRKPPQASELQTYTGTKHNLT